MSGVNEYFRPSDNETRKKKWSRKFHRFLPIIKKKKKIRLESKKQLK